MDLTSDPHAWLRPYYVALKANGGLQKLAIPLRFETLCCAVEGEHPSRAAAMRDWSAAAKDGTHPNVIMPIVGQRVEWDPRTRVKLPTGVTDIAQILGDMKSK